MKGQTSRWDDINRNRNADLDGQKTQCEQQRRKAGGWGDLSLAEHCGRSHTAEQEEKGL